MTNGPATPKSFQNTWVRSLAIRLPPLALAVDDAMIALAERAASLLHAPQPPPLLHAAAEVAALSPVPVQQNAVSIALLKSCSWCWD